MNRSTYELQATIKLHRQTLLQEAEQQRLLIQRPARRARLEPVLARIGRLLVAIGTRLETRYAAFMGSAD